MDTQALWLTLRLAGTTTLVLLLLAVPLAWVDRKWEPALPRALIQSVVALPLVLPPTVLGFYLLVTLGPLTAPGRLLTHLLGHPLAFSFTGLVVGSILYSLPFAVQPLVAGFRSIGPEYLEAAAGLGVDPAITFRQVILPMSQGSVVAAAVLTFTHTVGEFGVVLMLGGNIPGATRTLSISLFDQVQDANYTAANHTALLLVVVAVAALLVVYTDSPDAEAMSSDSHLQVELRHRLGTLSLDLAFATSAPWTILFGPSGSGKSTILRAIAGLVQPDRGRITLNEKVLFDTATNISIPAHRRGIRWASQSATLFPRMTVEENLAFGLASASPVKIAEALERFHLTALARKKPSALSGGERQRVSVARAAIGARGKLLLLDEPFTGLDASIRAALIEDLRAWLGNTPVLSVTHDVSEAFLLNAEVIKLAEGRVLTQGPVAVVLSEERRSVLGLLS